MPTVIKADDKNPVFMTTMESVDTSDHIAEAKVVVKKAREKAQEILDRTRVEADEMRDVASKQGYEDGFKRGYEAGLKAGHQAAFEEAQQTFASDQARMVAMMKQTIDTFEERKRDLFIAAKQDILKLAELVAERVTKQVGAVNCEAAIDNLQAALELVEGKTDLVVRISRSDQTTMERFAEEMKHDIDNARHVTVVVDESIAPGGCHVSTKDTDIDATLDAQLAQIAELVAGGGKSS